MAATGTRTAPRRRLAPAIRREELLVAAAELFDRHAYDQLTAEQLAEGCGVSVGLLYHYFGNKRDLYVACLERMRDDFLAAIDDPGPALPLDERLRHALDSYLDFVEDHPRRYVAVLRGGIGLDQEVHALVQGARQQFFDFIAGGLGIEDPSPGFVLAIWGFMGFVEATCTQWLETPTVERDEIRDLLAETALSTITRALVRRHRRS